MQLIAAPKFIENATGVAGVKVTARKLVCVNWKMETMFGCNQLAGDFLNIEAASTVPEGFGLLVQMIAKRHIEAAKKI